jgi:peroxiredoxin
MTTNVQVGQKAPDFKLVDNEFKSRSLRDFQGSNLVLAFFPGAFTSVCTKEMCTFRDSLANLGTLKARVVGISVNDPWSSKAFAEKNMLNFPLLCDYNREVTRLYGIELPNFGGLPGYIAAKRSIFIVDKQGMVRYVWVSDDPRVEPNYAEIAKSLEQVT